PLSEISTTSFWHIDAVGGRPPHQPPALLVAEGVYPNAATRSLGVWVPAFAGTTGADELAPPRSRRLPDLEAVEIVLRSSRVEGLAHHHKALAGRSRRRQPGLGHQLGGVGGEIDLRGDPRIIQIALDLTPALHLRHDPDRKRLPRERIEIDAVRLGDDIAQPVCESAGENLLQYG